MSRINSTRSGCGDVFRAFLVKDATYDSKLEIPCLAMEKHKPIKLIAFSKAIRSTEFEAWVHFYEDDRIFERIWNKPCKYLGILKKFAGVITPDFSIYRDMPLVMQQWNVYRSRAIGIGCRKMACRLFQISDLVMNAHMNYLVRVFKNTAQSQLAHMVV